MSAGSEARKRPPPRPDTSAPQAGEANIRKAWVQGELAARRVPDLSLLADPVRAATLREVAARWLDSRIDVADHTRLQHRSDLNRATALLDKPVDEITSADAAALVAKLAETRNRETVMALAMVFDHAGVVPDTARDKRAVRRPRGVSQEIKPPPAARVQAVHDPAGALQARAPGPRRHGDASLGARAALLGDVDESGGRWRVSAAVSKTGKAR